MKHNLAIELSLLGVLALLWGSSYLFVKIAVSEIPPITLIAVRVGGAAIVLLALVWIKRESLPTDAPTWGALLIQSFLNSIGAWTVLAWGQQFVDSGLAAVLNSTAPIFIFFITLLITRHESLHMGKLIGACLGVLGVTLIVGTEALDGLGQDILGQDILGQAAVLSGAVMYAIAAIYGTRFHHLSATVVAACTMLWATVWLVPLSLLFDQPWQLRPSTTALMAAGALSILCTSLALLIYFRLLKTLGSMGTASQSYLRAGVGIILGVVVLGEVVPPMLWLGVALSLMGIAAINLMGRKPG